MPGWYFEKRELKNTPSTQDGIDYKTEMRYRKEGARFIMQTGFAMKLGCNTTATGIVYYHRFYMFHSFQQFPRYVTACCCLFLAGKVEETPKKCKDIIKAARNLLTDATFATFGNDPKEEVMTLERILLQTIKFDLQVDHPYGYLTKYAKCLKGDKAKLDKSVQMAWNFVNDSMCTTLPLQWEPEIIAVALMYLAGKLNKLEVNDWVGRTSKHLRWWDMFVEGVTLDLLEDICHQVLDFYSQNQNPTVQPQTSPVQQPRESSPPATPSTWNGHDLVSPGQPPPINTNVPPPSEIPYMYGLPPPVQNYPAYPAPHPNISAPPPAVFPYVGHPSSFPPPVVQPAPPFYPQNPPPNAMHRPFFPPPNP